MELASFFSKNKDYWLSDLFDEKCLSIVQRHSGLDKHYVIEAYQLIGLVWVCSALISATADVHSSFGDMIIILFADTFASP